jgi:hypothetical protein
MTPKGTTASDINRVMTTVPKMAGKTPPSLLASRGPSRRNSRQRSRYTRSVASPPRAFAG